MRFFSRRTAVAIVLWLAAVTCGLTNVRCGCCDDTLSRLRTSDENACYALIWPAIARTVGLYVESGDVDDLTQEIVMKLHGDDDWSTYSRDGRSQLNGMTAYARTIAMNYAKRGKRPTAAIDLSTLPQPPVNHTDASDTKAEKRALKKAIAEGPKHAEAVVDGVRDGKTQSEIAGTLGVTRERVAQIWSKVRIQARNNLMESLGAARQSRSNRSRNSSVSPFPCP